MRLLISRCRLPGLRDRRVRCAGKPVGLVHFAAASRRGQLIHAERAYGDIGRSQVRRASVGQALSMLREIAEKE